MVPEGELRTGWGRERGGRGEWEWEGFLPKEGATTVEALEDLRMG